MRVASITKPTRLTGPAPFGTGDAADANVDDRPAAPRFMPSASVVRSTEPVITRTLAPEPGMVRYTVTVAGRQVIRSDVADDIDSEDAEWFIRTYLRRNPPNLFRAARAVRDGARSLLGLLG